VGRLVIVTGTVVDPVQPAGEVATTEYVVFTVVVVITDAPVETLRAVVGVQVKVEPITEEVAVKGRSSAMHFVAGLGLIVTTGNGFTVTVELA
jgi:hypothetical protein